MSTPSRRKFIAEFTSKVTIEALRPKVIRRTYDIHQIFFAHRQVTFSGFELIAADTGKAGA